MLVLKTTTAIVSPITQVEQLPYLLKAGVICRQRLKSDNVSVQRNRQREIQAEGGGE